MSDQGVGIRDIEPLAPFSRGSTEGFLTGHWSSRKPVYVEKVSPCRQACPIGIDIARAFHQASLGEWDEALAVYRRDNPLPGICGRVCYHPCELECNRKQFDEPINIRGFERFLSDHGRVDLRREAPERPRSEKVAVIGAGPAGLSASYHLARLGFQVAIFEALPEPGGMLRYGIPSYRLPREILAKEIGYIEQLGVAVRTGVRVGTDISLADIRKDYPAVFIAAGAHGGTRLGIDGENLRGVMEGIGFLREVHLGGVVKVGKRVAVIGGGNTAIDCARTARRLGAKDVRIIYRRSAAEMPALAEDVTAVQREGIQIDFLAAPGRVIARQGRVASLECIRMELGPPDESGRLQPVAVPGSEFPVPVDTVIAAVGQVPELGFTGGLGLSLNRRGVIEVSPGTATTSLEGVFAGGDSAGGRAFVADAIAAGKLGALAVFCYLEGIDIRKEFQTRQIGTRSSFILNHGIEPGRGPVDLKKIVSFSEINTLCFLPGPRTDNPDSLAPEVGIRTFEEVKGGLSREGMEEELSRCFQCGTCSQCDLCFLLCPDVSITKSSKSGYLVKTDYCKGCSICATTCPRHVIEMEDSR
jgi:NADPH-dependent glutamate synthase beta subunit-like oxidoreductase